MRCQVKKLLPQSVLITGKHDHICSSKIILCPLCFSPKTKTGNNPNNNNNNNNNNKKNKAARASAAGVWRFPGWHVLKLEFWHFPLPKFILRFLFSSVFAVFFNKEMPQTAGCTIQKPARLSVSHRFFRCFPVCVAFRIGICSVLAISRLSAHASFDLHSSFNSLRGFGGGWVGEWGGGGG